jgi:hypothetical protein
MNSDTKGRQKRKRYQHLVKELVAVGLSTLKNDDVVVLGLGQEAAISPSQPSTN